jgi:predicted PurR-regulated permease PerM
VRVCIYIVLLGVLRVRYFVLLAFLAGLANFIPYVGVAVAWAVYFLVAVFQGTTVFGLQPLPYAAIVSLSGWLIDNVYDNVYTPRVMAGSLKLHPASIMIAALVGLDLFGIVGMIFASPLLATGKLILRYIFNKIYDQDPWENIEEEHYSCDVTGFYGNAYKKAKADINKVAEKAKKIIRRKPNV